MVSWAIAGVLIGVFVVLGIVGFLFVYWLMYNIPVVVMRFQGDKRRPMLLFSKARKSLLGGVVKLYVRGYRYPVRDFKSEFYYPTRKGKYGGLLLWEPKPGFLTPSIPALEKQKKFLPKELKEAHEKLVSFAKEKGLRPVDFRFDELLQKNLLVKAVDDTDIDFMLQEIRRTHEQYTTGWREFLTKYGGHMIVAFVAMMMLVGFIMWMEKAPEMMGQCAAVSKEATENALQAMAGEFARPPA